jgi:hypothetical protein
MTIEHLMPVQAAAAAGVGNEPQNLLEHVPWDGDLGHLELDWLGRR